jgi:hypothetical protein
MKQLTILCSSDLSDTVQQALSAAGLEGFLQLTGASGFKPAAAAPRGDWPRWPAEMFVAAADDRQADRVVEALRAFAGRCEVEPCLRILVGSLEAVY